MKPNLRKELSPFLHLSNIVFKEDFLQALVGYDKFPNNQFIRRTLFRTGFAYIEGILYQFKISTAGLKLAQHMQKRRSDEWFLEESPYLGFLSDFSYHLKKNGEIVKRENFMSLELNIVYTLKEACETYFSSFKLDKGNQDWEVFLKAKNIRNRITHPKTNEDLFIQDIEVVTIKQTVCWFEKTIESLILEIDYKRFLISLQKKAEGHS